VRAFIVPEAVLPMAQATVFVDAPALGDPAGKEGLASLLAGILQRTGTATQSREQVEQALARLNAAMTIRADRNGTRLHLVSPPEALAEALSLAGKLIAAPDLASVFEAERERAAVASGRAGDSPAFKARLLFDQALYGKDHPAARRPTPASIRAIALEDVRQLHRSRYRADRIALAVSGRIERGPIEAAVASAFGGMSDAKGTPDAAARAAERREGRAAGPRVTGRVVVAEPLDIRQAHVHIGHAGIQGIPEDHAALEVMNYILAGGGFVSRMMKLLRTDTGITSALYGSVEPGREIVNPYLWSFTGAPETIARGVNLAIEQIQAMHEKGVTAEEFEAARTAYIDGLVPASYETAHLVATRLATKALFGLYDYQSPQYLNYYAGDDAQLAALRALTLEDVNRAARKYLDPQNIVIAAVGPRGVSGIVN
jgi:zinc protease